MKRHQLIRSLTLLVLALVISLTLLSHYSPLLFSPYRSYDSHQKRGIFSSKEPQDPLSRQPRTVSIVTDTLRVDPVPPPISHEGTSPLNPDSPLYPSHSFLLLSATRNDPALRVELVAPTTTSTGPLGLALCVTEYSVTRKKDRPKAVSSPARASPSSASRKVISLPDATLLTNEQIFSPTEAAGSPDGEPSSPDTLQSLLSELWTVNVLLHDNFGTRAIPPVSAFGSSHELIGRLLWGTPLLRLEQDVEGIRMRAGELMRPGMEWTAVMRGRNRGAAGATAGQWPAIEQLFYERVVSGERRGREKKTQRMRFVIDRSGVRWGSRRMEDAMVGVELSRDPRLTSGVLPVREGGASGA